MDISVFGLGKLGSVMAGVFAESGHNVIGVDANPSVVAKINAKQAPVEEPGLEELIAKNHTRLCATTSFEDAVHSSDVSFIIVPTPSQSNGAFTPEYVRSVAQGIGSELRAKDAYHLVVISSTLMPGHCDEIILPALLEASDRNSDSVGLCYSPEFIALGNVIHDMQYPDMVLIGENDARGGQILESLYRTVVRSNAPYQHMNLVNAELTKIGVNTFCTTKISTANMIAEICEKLPGANAAVVASAMGLDSRIGKKYLKPGLGYGGPCFPRDNIAFARLARDLGVEATIAEAADRVNDRQAQRMAELIRTLRTPDETVGILGLSYKPQTPIAERAQGVDIAQRLLDVPLIVYDPQAMGNVGNVRNILGPNVRYASSMQECVQDAGVVLITTPWDEFKQLRQEHLNFDRGSPSVIDCWSILPRDQFSKVNYIVPGEWRKYK